MTEFETFRNELLREQNECAEQQLKNTAEKAEQLNKLTGFFNDLYHHLQSENIPLEKIEYMKDPETEVVVEKKGILRKQVQKVITKPREFAISESGWKLYKQDMNSQGIYRDLVSLEYLYINQAGLVKLIIGDPRQNPTEYSVHDDPIYIFDFLNKKSYWSGAYETFGNETADRIINYLKPTIKNYLIK